MSKPKIIAFYLPQYHPTPHNDEWWGKGFTEWTNVARAKPLFRGHEQPHIPGELGFYDLRLSEVREAQANLAKEYGIYGFCYYYYRFEKGKYELELPLNEVMKTGKPDFPFMICWANESWHKKFWKFDGTSENQILAEQKYGGKRDYIDFFYEVLPLFKDNRYIKVEDKPAFMVYKPFDVPNYNDFIDTWQELALQEGLKGIYFIGYIADGSIQQSSIPTSKFKKVKRSLSRVLNSTECKNKILNIGFNAVTINRQSTFLAKRSLVGNLWDMFKRYIFKRPIIIPYDSVISAMVNTEDSEENVFPIAVPNWDHSPRSEFGGTVFTKSTPELYKKHLKDFFYEIKDKQIEHQIVFLRAWNEWGEGNYIEPDLKWGRKYLEATKEAIDEFS